MTAGVKESGQNARHAPENRSLINRHSCFRANTPTTIFTVPNHTHNTMIPANKHMSLCVFIIKLELLKNQDYSCSAFAN